MAFQDVLQAIQFGVGLASGLTDAAQKSRQEQEANQLRLLQILAQDPNFQFVPAQPGEVERTGGVLGALFGTGGARTAAGEQAYRVGPNFLVRRETPPIPIPPELFQQPSYGSPSTEGLPPPARPLGGATGPEWQPPAAAPPRARPTAPGGPLTPYQRPPTAPGPAPEARAARAVRTYAGLDPAVRAQIDAAIEEAVRKYPTLTREQILATIGVESAFNPTAVSPAGAQGLMQLMPATAQALGVTDPTDIRQNILGGAQYLAQQLQDFGSPALASAAYNAGPGRVQQAGGVPRIPETQAYVPAVQAATQLFGQRQPDQRVAGPGALAARTQPAAPQEVPTAPVPGGDIPLPPARTAEEYITEAQRNVYRTLAPQLRNTPQGQQRLGAALDQAVQRGTLKAEREFKTARAEAERIKRERQIHSYEVLGALDKVQDTRQLKVILDYLDQHPDPDHLGDSVRLLARTPPEHLPEVMGRLYGQLSAANYSDSQIKAAWKRFERRAELPGLLEEERAKIRARAEEKPYEQAMALPGEVREVTAKEQARLTTQQAHYATLTESVAAAPGAYHTLPADARAAVLPGLVARGLTADDLAEPGVVEQRKLGIRKAQLELDKAIRQQEGKVFSPLEVQENALTLRKAIIQEPKFKIAQEITAGLGNVRVGASENSAAGDLAIVNGFAKILDPTSVVRPSEFTTVEQAQGFFQRLGMAYPRFMRGERLDPKVRQQFLGTAEKIAADKYGNARAEIEPVYKPRAQGLGVNFDEVFPNPFSTGSVSAPGALTPPTSAAPQPAAETPQPGVAVTPPQVPRTLPGGVTGGPANDPLGIRGAR